MSDWNQQGAPNNNLSSETIGTSKHIGKNGLKQDQDHEFSKEVSEGGKGDQAIKKQLKRHQPGMG